jgi:hypothetical protein
VVEGQYRLQQGAQVQATEAPAMAPVQTASINKSTQLAGKP